MRKFTLTDDGHLVDDATGEILFRRRTGDTANNVLLSKWADEEHKKSWNATVATGNPIKATDDTIRIIVEDEIERLGDNANLNHIDTSACTSFKGLFKNVPNFNGDISQWNTSNVRDMTQCFYYGNFNGDISNWNVVNLQNATEMFDHNKAFNSDISKWNTQSLKIMRNMFWSSAFTGDISKWNTANVEDMRGVFGFTQAVCNVGGWNTSNVKTMHSMFDNCKSFNQNLSSWNTSNVVDMNSMFEGTLMNGDISGWDTSNVKDMGSMFSESPFNGDISGWNTSNVENMFNMFGHATWKSTGSAARFNQDISNWNVAKVQNFGLMFENDSDFNQDLSNWNVSNAKKMNDMFEYCSSFNSDLSRWNVSNCKDFARMFNGTDYILNHSLEAWNVTTKMKTRVANMFGNKATNPSQLPTWYKRIMGIKELNESSHLELDKNYFKEQPLAAVVEGMGFKDPSEAAKEIFALGLENNNWIKKIETPVSDDEYSNKVEDMVKSLEVDKLGITDVDDEYHRIQWWDYQGAFYSIASDPDLYWVAEDMVGGNHSDKAFACNIFMQLMVFDEPLYFG